MQPLTHFLLRNLQAPHGEEEEEEEAAIDGTLYGAIINTRNGEKDRRGEVGMCIYIYSYYNVMNT